MTTFNLNELSQDMIIETGTFKILCSSRNNSTAKSDRFDVMKS